MHGARYSDTNNRLNLSITHLYASTLHGPQKGRIGDASIQRYIDALTGYYGIRVQVVPMCCELYRVYFE